ncbi:NACHT domain-containing protein [Hymenobacter psychrophilus]|uniref:NACHT domain-containing protein n=1 Tax=Hymenobacter psychrophilus TaxID=651662 RepID=A0A1H3LJY3_9BACT|nr:NACHT domain-containing protein [Hymenobacter psychrophilus]SDY64693.1 NACHT domain-containing protein [Hymenobacter psychrophilus]
MPISKETIALLSAFKSPILETMKGAKDEVSFFFDNGVATYIDNLIDKIKYTKTFLHRSEDVYFYDTYFPVTLTRKLKNNDSIEMPSHEPFELFKLKRFISVIGNAGSGKTMFMKQCFLSALESKKQIPILIELRNISREEISITDYIYKHVLNNKLSPSQRILERILEKGKFLFLLDGFDEIFSNNKAKIIEDIENFVDKYNKNYFLITSRPGANAESIPRFLSYYVSPLSENEISRFVHVQLRDDAELEKRVQATVAAPESKDYKSYLSSPLLLSMFILTYNLYPELPKSKSKFYWNVFDTLCTKHDSYTKKGGFLHERKSGLQHEELENVLKWLAYVSLFEGKYTFDEEYLVDKLKNIREKLKLNYNIKAIIDDFVVSISIIILDGFEYKFPHKSLQEYLAALLVREQSEEAKTKVYYERFASIENKGTGGNENLWSICIELDKYSFYNNFFIKHLSNFLIEIKKGGEKNIVKNFFTFYDNGEGIIIKNSEIDFHSFTIPTGPIFPILAYHGLQFDPFDFILSYHYEKKEIILELYKDFISESKLISRRPKHNDYWIKYKDLWNWNSARTSKVFHNSQLEKKITSLKFSAMEILDNLKENLAEDSKIKNDLLDL